MKNFRDLKVWNKAHEFTLEIYELTKNYPRDEIYGITSQMRRAAVSVPANIAEGCCRHSDLDLARFLQISIGSASEVEYYLLLSKDLNFITEIECKRLSDLIIEIKRMLSSFLKTLRNPDEKLVSFKAER